MLEIEKFINNQNEKIWLELKSKYNIQLVYSPKESSWRADTDDKINKLIITPKLEIDIPSFTHELLHLYIEDKGMTTARELLYTIRGDLSFDILTNKGLIGIIHNFCCHKKMYAYYNLMGFPDKSFVSRPARLKYLTYLGVKYELKVLTKDGITDYIGHCFALFNNMGQCYSDYNKRKLKKLKKLEPTLFEIIQTFDRNWSNNSELDLLTPFLIFNDQLESWLKSR